MGDERVALCVEILEEEIGQAWREDAEQGSRARSEWLLARAKGP